ncbi:MAG: penicillin acylase family protein [Armatimonadota bacterium]|nr:penicillin acylase family protein [Armatimonadota bacterium]MDR5696348.1 penicillin acylase family protein [Armatimonadota bacterium]
MRVARIVLIAVLALVIVAGGGAAYAVRRAYPRVSGSLIVPGLQAPVEVVRDRWGVPHIYARNERDLFFAQGFVHAQDRLWQMEMNRRTGSGRLSEIFGERTLGTDRFLRTIGLRRAAELEWQLLSPQTRGALEAYAAGVNAFLAHAGGRLPAEFLILGFRPEPWHPLDSLVFGKLMAYDLGGNWQTEILRAMLVARFGPQVAGRLVPAHLQDSPIIVPEATSYEGFRDVRLPAAAERGGQLGVGSNNWVLAGARTDSGRPYLANDPHLRIAFPSIWYEIHLEGGPYRVAGFSFAGVPGVIIGHNDRIAWGVTNANPDVQDLYIERFHPDDPHRYLYRGVWLSVEEVVEEIRVRGRVHPERLVVRLTRHGPLINDVVDGLREFVALRWTALLPSTVAEGVLRYNRARDWQEFREALQHFHVPAQNFVYADVDGNIGYQLPGWIPIRARGDGTVPVPGWTGEYEWTGWIPYEELPSVFNPPRGWIATANNRIAPDGYRYLLGTEWAEGLRARRIADVLEARAQHAMSDLQALQNDNLSLPALRIAPVLAALPTADESVRAAQQDLRRWDGVLMADSRAAAIYQAFLVRAVERVFKPVLGQDVWDRYARRHFVMGALLGLWERPDDPWWGPGGRDRTAEEVLREAVADLTSRLGPDRTKWTWGALHQVRFNHTLGEVPVLGRLLNLRPMPSPGDGWTVNQAAYSLLRPFDQTVVASMRMILDVGEWDRSVGIHTTGQSGLPFHPHRGDFAPLWVRGDYHPMPWTAQVVRAQAAATLTLQPGP